MNNLFEIKTELRKKIKLQKLAIGKDIAAQKSTLVFDTIEKMGEFANSKIVLAFWSMSDEIDTHSFVTKQSEMKKMALPVIIGNDLELRLFNGATLLEQNSNLKILEPTSGQIIDPLDIDFAIIPGVAFDSKGNRLGRGKGFYDRLIPKLTKAIKVGIGYDFQLVDYIPVSEYDLPVDLIICR